MQVSLLVCCPFPSSCLELRWPFRPPGCCWEVFSLERLQDLHTCCWEGSYLNRPSFSEVCRPIHQCCSWPLENWGSQTGRGGLAGPLHCPRACPSPAHSSLLAHVPTFCRLCPRKSSSAWLCTEASSAWNHVQMSCACAHVEWCSKNLYSASWKRSHSCGPEEQRPRGGGQVGVAS